jgi:hypothetical protein
MGALGVMLLVLGVILLVMSRSASAGPPPVTRGASAKDRELAAVFNRDLQRFAPWAAKIGLAASIIGALVLVASIR